MSRFGSIATACKQFLCSISSYSKQERISSSSFLSFPDVSASSRGGRTPPRGREWAFITSSKLRDPFPLPFGARPKAFFPPPSSFRQRNQRTFFAASRTETTSLLHELFFRIHRNQVFPSSPQWIFFVSKFPLFY